MQLRSLPHEDTTTALRDAEDCIQAEIKACKLPLPTRIAFVGNHLPRQCGIATFTTDLCAALGAEFGAGRIFAIPVNDPDSNYDYPEEVRLELEQEDEESYERAAEFLNFNGNDLVCLQHEFGIYGGVAGRHILALLRRVKMPVVTTLHTVLRDPNPDQRAVLEEIVRLSDRLVVMSAQAAEFLSEVYDVPAEKIDVIPHGVPDFQFMDPNYFKDEFGVAGKQVLLTFGLLSPNKGIEHVIEALPAILLQHPNVVYIVLGATHPNLLAHEGESYRLKLERLAQDSLVAGNVIFYNRFVTLAELTDFIGAADIYITPYLNEAQITSGTLAYAIGAGKAVISTPYWYARELLAKDRGILVPFADPNAIAEGVNRFLSDSTLMTAMRKRAWKAGREMIWPVVARRYLESFDRARSSLSAPSVQIEAVRSIENANYPTPPLKLDHLIKMSDQTGIFQHAIYNVPNCTEGYCTDDNARAFILTVLLAMYATRWWHPVIAALLWTLAFQTKQSSIGSQPITWPFCGPRSTRTWADSAIL